MKISKLHIGLVGFGLAMAAALMAISSGLGHRWGVWDFPVGFTILKWALYLAVGATVVSLAAIAIISIGKARRGLAYALLGVFLGGIVAWIPWNELQKIQQLPPIHDITTDTGHPPEFIAVLPLRGSGSNSTDYAGPVIAEMQRQGYPDIVPLTTTLSLKEAFDVSLNAAKSLGWEIVAAELSDGRIEATDTTRWFGFKDDVVIRIASVEQGTRIDVRSISRVGGSDVGANAARIREFFQVLQDVK